jgi:hypothetical protein
VVSDDLPEAFLCESIPISSLFIPKNLLRYGVKSGDIVGLSWRIKGSAEKDEFAELVRVVNSQLA